MKRGYWILTIQRSGDFSTETIWIEGTINSYLLIERELGRKTNVVFAHEITKEEYQEYIDAKGRSK